MFAPSNDFHEKIKDPSVYPQNLVLQFADGYLSANDGDIEQGGVEFEDYFCTEDDLVYGECPSALMRASLINVDKILRSMQWGECNAYIGYRYSSIDNTLPDGVNSKTTVLKSGGGINFWTVYAKTDGLFVDSTEINSAECYSLVNDYGNKTVYAFGDGYAYKIVFALDNTYTATSILSPRYMNEKMRFPKSVIWNGSGASDIFSVTTEQGGKQELWYYAPMGVFNVTKPKNLSGDVVDIDEAFDRMRLFDVDATDFLANMQSGYPTGADIFDWVYEMCGFVGCPVDSATLSSIQTDFTAYTYTPNTSTTLRTILGYLAEAFGGVFRFSRTGVLELVKIGTDMVEEVGLDRIENSTLATAEFVTKTPNKIINKNLAGLTYVTGSGKNPYYILGNPFVQDNSHISLSDVAFYKYCPLSCRVLEADPCVDMGDAVGVWLTDEEYSAFVDAYNRLLTDEDGLVYTQTNVPVKTPLMHRILRWNGVCTADYEATGNETRLVPSELESIDYNTNIANDTDNIINRLLVGDLFARYIEATNFHLKGGTMSVEASSSTDNRISLTFDNGSFKWTVTINPTAFTQETEAIGAGVSTARYGAGASWEYVWDSDGSGTRYEASDSGIFIRTRADSNSSWVKRAELTENGLNFYNASGTLTKSYPAT